MTKKGSSEDRKAQIMQAAARCFARKGYHLTTMDDVAAESGLSKGSLYWHFENKEDLLIALTRWYLSGFDRAMDAVQEADLGCAEKLGMIVDVIRLAVQQDDSVIGISLDYMAHARSSDKMREALLEVYESWMEKFRILLDDCVKKGELRAVDTTNFSTFLFAALDGLLLYHALLRPVDWDGIRDAIVDVLLNGMLPEDSADGTQEH